MLIKKIFWAFPFGSGHPLQSFSFRKRISVTIPNAIHLMSEGEGRKPMSEQTLCEGEEGKGKEGKWNTHSITHNKISISNNS